LFILGLLRWLAGEGWLASWMQEADKIPQTSNPELHI